MKIQDVEIKTKDSELTDFIDNVQQILNSGKYQLNVVNQTPSGIGSEGETVLYSASLGSNDIRRLYIYAGGQWNYIPFGDSTGQVVNDGTIAIGNFLGANNVDGMWLGATTFNKAPFRVDLNGNLYATSATISGTINAISGNIGGWVINQFGLLGGSGEVGMLPGSYPFFAGNVNPALAPFSVTFAGVLTAASGTIGGWVINATSLASSVTVNTANVLLDPVNSLIRLGSTVATYLTVDGANKRIRTSDFVSGSLGSGWNIDNNYAEFNNIKVRGIINTSVFLKTAISSVGGNFLVCDSDLLATDIGA